MPVTRRAAALARSQKFDPDAFVKEVVQEPDIKLVRDEKMGKLCRSLLAHIYARQSAFAYGEQALKMQFAPTDVNSNVPLGPLTKLEYGSEYDCDQLWVELEMRNSPVCDHLADIVKRHVELDALQDENDADIEVNPQHAKVADVIDEESVNEESEGEEVEEDDDAPQPTSILKKPKSDSLESNEKDEEDMDEANEEKKSKRRVQFADENDEKSADEEEEEEEEEANKEKDDKKNSEVGFFSWADLDEVVDTADRLEEQGRLADSDSEDEDGIDNDDDGVNNPRYADFFDPLSNQNMGEENARALRRAELFDDPSEDEEVEKTPLELAREQMRETIEAMEDASVAKKPWQLRGEVLADSRPKNSVLDANFEHDIALTSRAAHAAASMETIEALIKRRVKDGLYDDPVRVLPREYKDKKERKELPEVSQEKPTVGLGELYAEEFAAERERVSKAAEAASTVQKEEDEEETDAQKEVTKACKALCRKLDALASLHFTPTLPHESEEMEVRPNVPALAAEEAIPVAVSDAQLLAPGEVHRPEKKERVGELEKVKKDRKRNRRATKKRLRELTKERTSRVRMEEAADPELAEKGRAERALERRGKKRMASEANPGQVSEGHYSKSNRFFKGLQMEVESEIERKKTKRNHEDVGRTRNAAALKL